ALARAGWDAAELDFWEVNEAFASVALQSARDRGGELERVNIHGWAIALGHPIGASGARLALTAALALARRGTGKAAGSLCGGGGPGGALLLGRGPVCTGRGPARAGGRRRRRRPPPPCSAPPGRPRAWRG
ncbi:hypothetical protein ACVB9L_10910, partial [Rothia kristinae]